MMASVTQDGNKTKMADESEERSEQRLPAPGNRRGGDGVPPPPGEGFFTIRKKGQGYWTRMLTAVGAALLVALSANFIYQNVLVGVAKNVKYGVVGGFVAVAALLVWWIINRPQTVEFLIATDSEMKKVNWTSREELIGSTKVVVLFMFMIAFFLFFVDLVFGYLFKFMTVLKFGPFG